VTAGDRPSLIDGLDALVHQHLRLEGGRSRRVAYRTRDGMSLWPDIVPPGFDGAAMLEAMVDRIAANHRIAPMPFLDTCWRWGKARRIADHNPSKEKRLEKRIVQVLDDSWANQIAVTSGHRFRGRVDLAHALGDGRYEMIELKVASDTPLFAAVELCVYAAIYLFTRAENLSRGRPTPPLLEARALHWQVLAPMAFYAGADLAALERALSDGLSTMAERRLAGAAAMDFAFTAFDPAIPPDDLLTDVASAVSGRRRVTASERMPSPVEDPV
jgi:hypothetical protein